MEHPQLKIQLAVAAQLERERQLRSVLEPPPGLFALQKEIAAQNEMMRSIVAPLRHFDEMNRVFTETSRIRELVASVTEAVEGFRAPILELERSWAGMSSPFAAIQDDLMTATRTLSSLAGASADDFRSMSQELIGAFERGLQTGGASGTGGLLDEVAETAHELVKEAEADPFAATKVSVLVTLLLFLIQLLLATAREGRITEHVEGEVGALGETMGAAIAALVVAEDAGDPLWVPTHFLTRDLHLRHGPSTTEPSLRILPTNSLLEVVELEAGWIRVRSFDWAEVSTVEGWVYGRYVRELHPDVLSALDTTGTQPDGGR